MSISPVNGTLLGAIILIRHGDREGFYQSDTTYTATATAVTPLGNQQEYQLGEYLRSLYIDPSSPSYILGMNYTLFDDTQVIVRGDAGGEGDVIMASVASMVQGLWPATTLYNTTLANGTNVVGPLGGYQYVPIESVYPSEDVSLEGFTDCNTFDTATTNFYNSPGFLQVANDSASFLNQLPPYLDGRPVTLENMWNIFDYINVNSIHNAQFNASLPPTFLAQARALANYHEYGVFSSPELNGAGNIAGQTFLAQMISSLSLITNTSQPVRLDIEAMSYKPFISMFNMTSAVQDNPELAGIVNYAAAVSYEVRQPSDGGEPVIRFNFKNGTDDAEFRTLTWFNGSTDVPVSTFVNYLGPVTVNTTAQWCQACSNTQDNGCAALTLAYDEGRASKHQTITPVGAGFLGAGLTVAVFAMLIAALYLAGFLLVGKRSSIRRTRSPSEQSAEKKI